MWVRFPAEGVCVCGGTVGVSRRKEGRRSGRTGEQRTATAFRHLRDKSGLWTVKHGDGRKESGLRNKRPRRPFTPGPGNVALFTVPGSDVSKHLSHRLPLMFVTLAAAAATAAVKHQRPHVSVSTVGLALRWNEGGGAGTRANEMEAPEVVKALFLGFFCESGSGSVHSCDVSVLLPLYFPVLLRGVNQP